MLYSRETQLVFTFKHGVFVFTLDENGQFVQTGAHPQVPAQTKEFAIDMSNQRHWYAPMQRYIAELLAGDTGPRAKNYDMRWVASDGGRNPPHPDARRRVYVSARRTRPRPSPASCA